MCTMDKREVYAAGQDDGPISVHLPVQTRELLQMLRTVPLTLSPQRRVPSASFLSPQVEKPAQKYIGHARLVVVCRHEDSWLLLLSSPFFNAINCNSRLQRQSGFNFAGILYTNLHLDVSSLSGPPSGKRHQGWLLASWSLHTQLVNKPVTPLDLSSALAAASTPLVGPCASSVEPF